MSGRPAARNLRKYAGNTRASDLAGDKGAFVNGRFDAPGTCGQRKRLVSRKAGAIRIVNFASNHGRRRKYQTKSDMSIGLEAEGQGLEHAAARASPAPFACRR